MFTAVKDPGDVLPYQLDWAANGPNDASEADNGWLQGYVITASSWAITDGPDDALVLGTDTRSDVLTTVDISGGTPGATYIVTNTITPSSDPGHSKDQSLEITIQNT